MDYLNVKTEFSTFLDTNLKNVILNMAMGLNHT